MRHLGAAAVALLAANVPAPALGQSGNEPATQFFGSICEIDTTPLEVDYVTPDDTRSVFTFESRKLCTGEASARNVKLECSAPLPGWGSRPDVSAAGFVCTINGDQCGLSPLAGDENAPFLTATQSSLAVTSGVARLTCFYKP